jgi:ribosomal protein S27AE
MTRKQNICPRCGGNLFLERDEYDQHLYCLQCGFRTELEGIDLLDYEAKEGKQEILPIPR